MNRIYLSFLMTFAFYAVNAQTQGVLSVNVTTAATNMGYYSASNVEAIWIEDSWNKFIKTLFSQEFQRAIIAYNIQHDPRKSIFKHL